MPGRYGKPDATGRSSGVHSGQLKKVLGPPKGIPWCWITRDVFLSPALRALSSNGRKLIDFLCAEHCSHAGQENGELRATYDQLAGYGITREYISSAIDECIALGFLRTGPRLRRIATAYRLTFYGTPDGAPPTNDWERITPERARALKKEFAKRRNRKNQESNTQTRTSLVREAALNRISVNL